MDKTVPLRFARRACIFRHLLRDTERDMDLSHPSTKLLIDECKAAGLLRNQCAYVLATAWHETGRYRYMREIWGPTAAQKRYEGRKDLGNVKRGDGKKFMGRGFVQITGRRNYEDWARRTGLPLIDKPELAEKPEVAVGIIVEGMRLGTFTGKKLADYVTLAHSDFHGARRIVNGLDRADLIAGYAREFDALLKAAGYGVTLSAAKPAPAPAPKPAAPAPKEPNGGRAGIVALLLAALATGTAAAWGWLSSLPCSVLGLLCGG